MAEGETDRGLGELLALAVGGELRPLRAAIGGLTRRQADALLLGALLRLASHEAAMAVGRLMAGEDRPTVSEDVEELGVDDPFCDESARSAYLDRARTLRLAWPISPS